MAFNQYRAGNWTFDTPSNAIVLFIPASSAVTASQYQSFYKQDGSGINGIKYPITAGKTFYATNLFYIPTVATSFIALGYADNGVDNVVVGSVTNLRLVGGLIPGIAANTLYQFPVFFSVPATKIPILQANAGANPQAFLIGTEI